MNGQSVDLPGVLAAVKDDRKESPEPWRVNAKTGLTKIMAGDTVIARVCGQPNAYRNAIKIAAAPTMMAMLYEFLETGLDADRLTVLAEAVDDFLNDLEIHT